MKFAGKVAVVTGGASVVSFLASDDASFMNGHVYFVDDGSASFKR